MKNVLLSADGEISVFSVPDDVADNLERYCLEFCDWVHSNAAAEKYLVKTEGIACVCFDENTFIDYLNEYVCEERSTLVATFSGVYDECDLPEEYVGLPYFNF